MIRKVIVSHNEVIYSFFWRFLQIVVKEGILLSIFFMAAKHLKLETFGMFNYLLAVMALLIIISDFGISASTARFTANYRSTKSKDLRKIFFSVSLLIIVVVVLLTIFLLVFGRMIFKDSYPYVLLFLPYLLLVPLSSTIDAVYRGLKEFKKLSLISLASGIVSLFFSYYFINQYKLLGAIFSYNFFFLALVISLVLMRNDIIFEFDKKLLTKVFKYSVLIGMANVAFFFYTKVDIIILKQFGFLVEIGYYGVITNIFNVLILPALILGTVLAPDVIELITKNKFLRVKRKLYKYSILFLITGVLLSIILYFLIPILLRNFLPKFYSPNFLLIFNLLLLLFPLKLWGVFFTNGFITPGGFVKLITITTIIGAVLNVICDYIFIIHFGFVGVFYAKLLIHSIIILVNFLYFNRILDKHLKGDIFYEV